jgi:hypothetical protein
MYERLAAVLRHTATRHCEGWGVNVERIRPRQYVSAMGNLSHAWNTQKLEHWRDVVLRAADGDRVLLIDADTAVIRPLSNAWNAAFDLAYTVRDHGLPLNGGVLFLRVSSRTRDFVDHWWQVNRKFLDDPSAHEPWRLKYAGINQASFGYLLENDPHGCSMAKFACAEWNAVGPEYFKPGLTRVVHIKSRVRREVFGVEPVRQASAPMVDMWHALERRVTR